MAVDDRLRLESAHHGIQGLHALGLVASEGVGEGVVKGLKRTRFDLARGRYRAERQAPIVIGRFWQTEPCAEVTVNLLTSGIRGVDRQPPSREIAKRDHRMRVVAILVSVAEGGPGRDPAV